MEYCFVYGNNHHHHQLNPNPNPSYNYCGEQSSSELNNKHMEEEKRKKKKKNGKKSSSKEVKLSTDPQSVAARERRHRISERFKILQSLVPGGTKMDTVSMLEEAIHYVKFLKTQLWWLNHHNMNFNNLIHNNNSDSVINNVVIDEDQTTAMFPFPCDDQEKQMMMTDDDHEHEHDDHHVYMQNGNEQITSQLGCQANSWFQGYEVEQQQAMQFSYDASINNKW